MHSSSTSILYSPRKSYKLFLSQYPGRVGPESPSAQLLTVRTVVYAIATKPKMQRAMSDIFHKADLATAR